MKRIIIFGNSGAGKSTLAKRLSDQHDLPHLDLDILAWNDTAPPTRAPIAESCEQIHAFTRANKSWVIEGGYADLLSIVMPSANEMLFLNLPVETCISNARKRPWEPHKYASIEKQDENLPMLIDWIGQYVERDDAFSLKSHRMLFDAFNGKKREYHSNDCDTSQNSVVNAPAP